MAFTTGQRVGFGLVQGGSGGAGGAGGAGAGSFAGGGVCMTAAAETENGVFKTVGLHNAVMAGWQN